MDKQSQLIQSLIDEVASLKKNLPNGNIVRIEKALRDMKENQRDMSGDLKDIKKIIMDPESGIIIRVNKNTSFREKGEEQLEVFRDAQYEFENLKAWKNTINKAIWVIYSAIIAVVIKVLFF